MNLLDKIIITTSMDKDELKRIITCFCESNWNIFKYAKKCSNSKFTLIFTSIYWKKHTQDLNLLNIKFISKNFIIDCILNTPHQHL